MKKEKLMWLSLKLSGRLSMVAVGMYFAIICSWVAGNHVSAEQHNELGVSDDVFAAMVRMTLSTEFADAKPGTDVYLHENRLVGDWLPVLSNVEIHLLTDEQLRSREEDFYFFKMQKSRDGEISIALMYGDFCGATGPIYRFTVESGDIRIHSTDLRQVVIC